VINLARFTTIFGTFFQLALIAFTTCSPANANPTNPPLDSKPFLPFLSKQSLAILDSNKCDRLGIDPDGNKDCFYTINHHLELQKDWDSLISTIIESAKARGELKLFLTTPTRVRFNFGVSDTTAKKIVSDWKTFQPETSQEDLAFTRNFNQHPEWAKELLTTPGSLLYSAEYRTKATSPETNYVNEIVQWMYHQFGVEVQNLRPDLLFQYKVGFIPVAGDSLGGCKSYSGGAETTFFTFHAISETPESLYGKIIHEIAIRKDAKYNPKPEVIESLASHTSKSALAAFLKEPLFNEAFQVLRAHRFEFDILNDLTKTRSLKLPNKGENSWRELDTNCKKTLKNEVSYLAFDNQRSEADLDQILSNIDENDLEKICRDQTKYDLSAPLSFSGGGPSPGGPRGDGW